MRRWVYYLVLVVAVNGLLSDSEEQADRSAAFYADCVALADELELERELTRGMARELAQRGGLSS
jgi:hypothetical protein